VLVYNLDMKIEAVIGLEIHVQISSKTKMFCRCDNDSFEKAPNTNVCPVCMGFPGQLPVVNSEAVRKGILGSLALNCRILEKCRFDRKNYFYPDSPKGFQISQFDEPLAVDGFLDVDVPDEGVVRIGVTRLHLEDDAGKLTHVSGGSLVDFNRSGTPLMEIVSEPDIRNSKQASAYAREVQKIMRYVGSGDADMEKGMMRFDASVSVREVGSDVLNPRAEIKNLNSFRSLERAIEFEIERQSKLFIKGELLKNAITVGFDDAAGETFFMRDKEGSDDYRYFPEPDIPVLHIDPKQVNEFRDLLPELPAVKKKRYLEEFGLLEDDARILSEDFRLATYFENVVAKSGDVSKVVSFINTVLMRYLKEELISIDEQKVDSDMMAELISLVNDGVISNNLAKGEVFEEMYKTGRSPKVIVDEKGLKQVSDTGAIETVCMEVMEEYPDSVNDIRNGKDKAVGFLIGMVMKKMKGQANPAVVSQVFKKLLK